MKIVINIPEEEYKRVMDGKWYGNDLADYIENGTLLQKGHGDLIDANELCEGRVSNDPVVIAAKCATTIIEADKEGEHDRI